MRFLIEAWQRLAALFRRQQLEQDLDEELAFHLAMREREHLRDGASPRAACAAARRQFGNVVGAKEQMRDAWTFRWLEEWLQDSRYAIRTFWKTPGFTVVAILTLALGIGANTTIFTLLDAVVFKPLPLPRADELVTLYENGPEGAADAAGGTGRFLRFSYPRFKQLEEALGSTGSLAAVTRGNRFSTRAPGATERSPSQGQLASGRFFRTVGVSAARGRLLNDDDVDSAAPVVVVSDGYWRRALGASDTAIGQTLIVNGVSVTVVGIAPPGFVGLWREAEADLWLPLTLQSPLHYQNNSSSYGSLDPTQPWIELDSVAWLNLIGRIPRASQPRARSLLEAANRAGVNALAEPWKDPRSRSSMLAHTLRVEDFSRGFSVLRAGYSEVLFVLGGMVAVVLLVTCVNIANLLLVRSAGNSRDVGLRVSLGATQGRLIRQFLTESLLLAVTGGVAGLLIGEWASGFLARQVLDTSGDLPHVFSPDRRVQLFAATLSLATAIVFGLAPALRAIQIGRVAALGGQRGAVGPSAIKGIGALVSAQLVLSVPVLFAAVLLSRTLINFTHVDPGFSVNHLVSGTFDTAASGYAAEQLAGLGQRLVDTSRTVSGVTAAVVSRCGLVAGCSNSSSFSFEGGESAVGLQNNWVGPGYFSIVGIPLARGREFDQHDGTGPAKVAMISESIAQRYFKSRNPIGQHLGFSKPDVEIVGVVRDARSLTLHEPPVPMIYFPFDQSLNGRLPVYNLDVQVSGRAESVISSLREAIQRAEPGLISNGLGTMSSRLERDLNRERVVAYLSSGFALLALILTSIGLYGVLSYGVVCRKQEIGVRMALGARRAQVIALVLRQSVRLTVIGMVLGMLAAAAAGRYLQGMLFGITPLAPSAFAAVALILGGVATLASYVPVRRATKVDPLVALRCE